MTTQTHPADCALCPILTTGEHVYVDPATQARRVAAARDFNQRMREVHRRHAEVMAQPNRSANL